MDISTEQWLDSEVLCHPREVKQNNEFKNIHAGMLQMQASIYGMEMNCLKYSNEQQPACCWGLSDKLEVLANHVRNPACHLK